MILTNILWHFHDYGGQDSVVHLVICYWLDSVQFESQLGGETYWTHSNKP
jgi:hypothetical protein